MSRQSADRKDSGEENGCRKDQEERIRQPVHIAQRNLRRGEVTAEICVEIVGGVEYDQEQRETEDCDQKDLGELRHDVAIERPNQPLDHRYLRRRSALMPTLTSCFAVHARSDS